MSRPRTAASQQVQSARPQLHSERLIVATNRGPVEYYMSQNKTLKTRRGSGGVITALIDAGRQMEMSWVAMAMTEGDRLAVQQAQEEGNISLPHQRRR